MSTTYATTTIFANPKSIIAWRAEAKRLMVRNQSPQLQYVQHALDLLDELYCLQNPQQKSPLQIRQAFFSLILEASLTGFPLAIFFEGLARKEGFGCNKDFTSGQALIQVAGLRKCAEALNYLALCYIKQDILTALSLFKDAASDGHVLALGNFQQLAEHVRMQMRRRRKVIEFAAQPQARSRFSL